MNGAGVVTTMVALVVGAVACRAARHVERRLPAAVVPPAPSPLAVGPARLARLAVAPLTVRRDRRRFDRQLPDAVAAVARGLRSGGSLRHALAEAAAPVPPPLGPQLRGVVASIEAGAPTATALGAWATTRPDSDAVLVATALSLAEEAGGPSARAVDGVAATLRRRLAGREEAVALAAQARLSALVLAGLPIVVCLLTLVGGGGSARFLLGTRVGALCLALGLALDLVGAWWMARLTRVDRRRRAA